MENLLEEIIIFVPYLILITFFIVFHLKRVVSLTDNITTNTKKITLIETKRGTIGKKYRYFLAIFSKGEEFPFQYRVEERKDNRWRLNEKHSFRFIGHSKEFAYAMLDNERSKILTGKGLFSDKEIDMLSVSHITGVYPSQIRR